MKLAVIAFVSSLPLAQAVAAAGPSPRDLRSAQCVAALDVDTRQLADGVKAGKDSLRPVLQQRLEAGAAFIGDAYVHGNSDEEQARRLTAQAVDAQKKLAPAELAALQRACTDEGAKLLADANIVQQAVVRRLAQKRLAKLLGA